MKRLEKDKLRLMYFNIQSTKLCLSFLEENRQFVENTLLMLGKCCRNCSNSEPSGKTVE
ncbi:hypothetical protein AM1_4037 [Acaryochloris marina MBIC11017]|uniref:Uncharacterized protein n=1 Tax=Acaryochloris marina (strain MBIC 11017) TaxID=329726 RepID=B0C9K7_ACAM1|nr:hypothetical protein AM1_4037 [Acaryochloris marina MBIC11017]